MTREVIIKVGTTGFSLLNDRIFELSAIEIIDGLEGETFHHYINPTLEFSKGATACTKVKLSDLTDTPLFTDICNNFLEFIKDSVIVMQNSHPNFDLNFINKELTLLGKTPIDPKPIKSVFSLYKNKMNIKSSRAVSLDHMCQNLDIEIDRSQGFTANYLLGRLQEVYSRLNILQPASREGLRLRVTSPSGNIRTAQKIQNIPFQSDFFDACSQKRKREEAEENLQELPSIR